MDLFLTLKGRCCGKKIKLPEMLCRMRSICDVTQVWGGPRATKHTKTPPNEEAGLPTELS